MKDVSKDEDMLKMKEIVMMSDDLEMEWALHENTLLSEFI